jgi:hypothetical protein
MITNVELQGVRRDAVISDVNRYLVDHPDAPESTVRTEIVRSANRLATSRSLRAEGSSTTIIDDDGDVRLLETWYVERILVDPLLRRNR